MFLSFGRSLVGLWILCWGISSAAAHQKGANPIADPEQIIELARKYYGPAEALDSVETIYYEGEVLDPKGEARNGLFRLFLKKPFFQRMELQLGNVVTINCTNGTEGYRLQVNKKTGAKKLSILPPIRVETLIISSLENLNFLRETKHRRRDVRYVDKVDFQGQTCYKLEFRYSENLKYERLINAQTGRVMQVVDHRGVSMYNRGEIFSEGVRFTKIVESYRDNQHLNTLQFNLVLLNKPIHESFFDFPDL